MSKYVGVEDLSPERLEEVHSEYIFESEENISLDIFVALAKENHWEFAV
jgi:hypothetical protein